MSRAAGPCCTRFTKLGFTPLRLWLLCQAPRCGAVMQTKPSQGPLEATRPIACMSNWRSLLTHGFLHRAGTAQSRFEMPDARARRTVAKINASSNRHRHGALKKLHSKKRCFQKTGAGLATGGRGCAPRRLCDCKPALHGWERRVLSLGTAARELTACANTNRTPSATSASAA